MNERQAIQQALAVVGSQQALLGEQVVGVTVAALKAKLAVLEEGVETAVSTPDRAAQRKHLTILFARVSGFTQATQAMPNTRMLNIINLLWRRLDGIITDYGGMVDKHMGDAVMGLFGVPAAAEDDPDRALRAALEMRTTLSDFVADMQTEFDDGGLSVGSTGALSALASLNLRVGINTGPVLVGEIGTGDEYTVIGDPVNVASRLEQKAPPDGILISHETYQLVRGAFDIESLGPMSIKGKKDPISVYLVSGVKSRTFAERGRGVEGVLTDMVGRDRELLRLQTALRDVVKNGQGEVVTVVGEAGIGKSRLIHEYTQWVSSLPAKINLLKAHAESSMRHVPYSLARNLFVTFWNIQDNDPASVVRAKLDEQLETYFPEDTPEKRQQRIRSFAQLFGLNVEDELPAPLALMDGSQVREETFADLAKLLRKAVVGYRASLVILEDVHWADEGSLELIDSLVALCRNVPMLFLCVTRPSLLDTRTTWGRVNGTGPVDLTQIKQQMVMLRMLTIDQSRQLARNILRYLPDIPTALLDMIVRRAEGNPFYVEELVKVLIEDGVIVPGSEAWRVLPKHLTEVRVPPTLTGVLQARLDRLSSLERKTLQRAAVIGRVFWDSAVMVMHDAPEETAVHMPETSAALQALEKREMIFQRDTSAFAGSSAYLFKHEMLREVAYESVLLRQRPQYHQQVAEWLIQESGERVAEYAGLIADHYEKAEQWLLAAEMFEKAGLRAADLSNLGLALTHFSKVFMLIEHEPHQNTWKISVLERLAHLYAKQARLVEAVDMFSHMRKTAELDGDLLAQTRALTGIARMQLVQQQAETARQMAEKAEQFAWLIGDDRERVQALLVKGQAIRQAGDIDQAVTIVQEALTEAEKLPGYDMVLPCLRSLIFLAIDRGRQTHIDHYISRVQSLIKQLDKAKTELSAIGAGFIILAEAYNRLGRYDQVARPALLAVRIFKKLAQQEEAAQALFLLAESGRLRGDYDQALPFYREALAVAAATGEKTAALRYRVHLGAAYVGLGQFNLAEREIRRVLRLAENKARFSYWRETSFAYSQLTAALLGLNQVHKGLAAAQKSYKHASHIADDIALGRAWWALGQAAARLRRVDLPITVAEAAYMPGDCFAESIRLLRRANGSSTGAFREQALVMWAWAQLEAAQDNQQRSQILRAEARALAAEIGLSLSGSVL